eukprot:scaffold9.g3306.t1
MLLARADSLAGLRLKLLGSGRRGLQAAPPCAQAGRRRKAAAAAPPEDPAAAASSDEELWQLHQELLEQVESGGSVGARALGGDGKESRAAAVAAPPAPAPVPAAPPRGRLLESDEEPDLLPVAPPAPAKPVNPNAMNIVFVGAECAPWSKTGGLGDVMGALPKALAARGHRVMVVAPRYKAYDDAWETGVRHRMHVFGAHQEATSTEAALEAPWVVPCGGAPYGDSNLLFVANDWHTALLPVYLQARCVGGGGGGAVVAHYRDHGKLTYARSVLAAAITCHRMVAVSAGYQWECQTQEGGWGLDGVMRENNWKFRGIVNGIDYDDWNPEVDAFLKVRGLVDAFLKVGGLVDAFLKSDGYVNYSAARLDDKARCKAALQKELGLPVEPDVPLLGFIGRLDYQKGVDLITDNYEWLMSEGCQLVMLGSGRDDLEGALRDMEARNRDKCRGWVGFSVAMAHRITAGADLLLMPSRFEPCGLNQARALYAMAYGTVPVVHAVGGLRDTVLPFNPFENTGTDSGRFRTAIGDALYTYRQYRDSFRGIQLRGMGQDMSWAHAAEQYEDVLVAAKFQW